RMRIGFVGNAPLCACACAATTSDTTAMERHTIHRDITLSSSFYLLLIHPCAGALHDLAPLRDFLAHVFSELLRRIRGVLEREHRPALCHVRKPQDPVDFGV